MTRKEYEERRRAFEEQYRAEAALLKAAHEVRLRSLDRLWQEALGPEQSAARPDAPRPVVQPRQAPRQIRPPYSVLDDLETALPRLPEIFDRKDIVRSLGYEPARTTLFRALEELRKQGTIEFETYSQGGATTRYRKLPNALQA